MTAAQLLASTFQQTRNLSRFYLSKLKGHDPLHVIEANGIRLNSIYWLTAHLAWAEHFLLLQGTGSDMPLHTHLQDYGFGSSGEVPTNAPSYKTILDLLNSQHELAMSHIALLTDEVLQQPNAHGIAFGGSTTTLTIIQHAIRHEGTHAGHFGWLCKLNGIATI